MLLDAEFGMPLGRDGDDAVDVKVGAAVLGADVGKTGADPELLETEETADDVITCEELLALEDDVAALELVELV